MPPKKLNPPVFIWTLIVISTLIGAFEIYQFLTTSQFPNPNQISPGKIQERGRNLTVADWKTYRNEEYGFEFRYPFNFQLNDPIQERQLFSGLKSYASTTNANPASLQGRCKVDIWILEKDPSTTLFQWEKDYISEGGTIITSDSLFIDGKPALRQKIGEIGSIDSLVIEISDSEILSSDFICGDDVQQLGTMEFDQILSTFKFIK